MTQQGDTPNGGQRFSMADMVGFMMRDLFSHGINMEEHLMQARQGAQNLGLQLRMAHRAMDEGERRIGELQQRALQSDEREDDLRTQLGNALGLLVEAKDMLRPFEKDDAKKVDWLAKCAAARAEWDRLHTKGSSDEGDVPLTYSEDTMFAVDKALRASGLNHDQAREAITMMQNAGIMFRERQREGMPMPDATPPAPVAG